MSQYKVLKHELCHSGQVVDFYANTIQLPNGRTAVWDYLEHKGAAGIVPVTSEGKIIMVNQYRGGVAQNMWEIPAGGINPGEDMLTCAKRELEEETGFRSEHIKPLINLHSCPSYCEEQLGIYYATDLIKSKQNLDEDEFVTLKEFTIEELVNMIFNGDITDSKTVASILAYRALCEKGNNL